mmetsp:Transcript_10590/g.29202  ORF Transcript_10590/g.29202 Transcript_10590/m.29202 type:complete len:182 (-) Transcript_10590:1318-1863(-)
MSLNNIGCCNYQMGNREAAVMSLQEANDAVQTNLDSSGGAAKASIELLHKAILLNNLGYLKLSLKQYEGARTLFDEALLVRESDAHVFRLLCFDLDYIAVSRRRRRRRHHQNCFTPVLSSFGHPNFFNRALRAPLPSHLPLPFSFTLLYFQIQQSVLGDAHTHRAIRDTRSNLEFTNAFHS